MRLYFFLMVLIVGLLIGTTVFIAITGHLKQTSTRQVSPPPPPEHDLTKEPVATPVLPVPPEHDLTKEPVATPVPIGSWEGWATTTQFGSGESCWPASVTNALNLACLNSAEKKTMGAAIPWRILCKTYKSRQNMLELLAPVLYENQADSKQQCFEVQPISVPPRELKQGSMDRKGFGTKYNVDDDSIVALDSSGKPYPTYILYPFEGCGGNCKGACPDCWNSCYGSVQQSPEKIRDLLDCDLDSIDTECCKGMKELSKNNWDVGNADRFLRYSDPLAINNQGDFESPGTLTVNWCSGLNYHFDIAMDTPLWSSIPPSLTNGPFSKAKGDLNNIVVRYRRIDCPVLKDCARC